MPAPQTSQLQQLAKTVFASKNIRLPIDWQDKGNQYPDAFRQGELAVAPTPAANLFREATPNKYHVQAARDMGRTFETFIQGICGSICTAVSYWMGQAAIAGIQINGPAGEILPGNVIGPDITGMIYANAPLATAQEKKYSSAVARAIGPNWRTWHSGLCGVLQYPVFAAFPGPAAPPTPNVPVPVAALASAGEAGLAPGPLQNKMMSNLGEPDALHASDLFDCIAKAFSTVFQTFKTSTLVMNVQGTGSVPAFAPPAVPAGPVVGGTSVPAPGVFI